MMRMTHFNFTCGFPFCLLRKKNYIIQVRTVAGTANVIRLHFERKNLWNDKLKWTDKIPKKETHTTVPFAWSAIQIFLVCSASLDLYAHFSPTKQNNWTQATHERKKISFRFAFIRLCSNLLEAKETEWMNSSGKKCKIQKQQQQQSGSKSHEKTIFLSRHNKNYVNSAFWCKVFLWLTSFNSKL